MNLADWQQQLQEGIKAVQARQAPLALQLLQSASSLQPCSREVAYWLGNAQRLNGQTVEAGQIFRSLLQHPVDFETAMALSFLLREQSRIAEAGDLLIGIARLASGNPEALLEIAGFLRDSNLFDLAIEVMQLLPATRHPENCRRNSGDTCNGMAPAFFARIADLDRQFSGEWQANPSLTRN